MLLVAKSEQHLPVNEEYSIFWQHVAQNFKGYQIIGDGQVRREHIYTEMVVLRAADLTLECLMSLFEAYPLLQRLHMHFSINVEYTSVTHAQLLQ